MRTSKAPATAPSMEGVLYFSAEGNKITREEFTKAKPYPVSVADMAAHLEALTRWMKQTEAM